MDYEEHGSELPRFADYRPTPHDRPGLGSEGQEDWRVIPVIQTRDSEALERSNFRVALARVEALDSEGEDHQVHRFGHWGPGWFEVIVVRPTPAMLSLAGEIACSLADYPILDESDFSELESEEAWEAWVACGYQEWCRALAPYVHETTLEWLEDATEDEQSEVLRAVDESSGDCWGHGQWSSHQAHAERATRDAFARLIVTMRRIRREADRA